MFKYRIQNILLLFLVMMAFSCAPTQKVREANRTVPKQYQGQTTDTLNNASMNWKKIFADTNLTALIDTALVNNQELNIFLQQMAVAKNEVKVRKGEYLPFLNYGAGGEVEKVGEFTRKGAVEKTCPFEKVKHSQNLYPITHWG